MTQPSSLTQTFDTSLVDVQRSFSSTETNTSGSSGMDNAPQVRQAPRREPSPYKTVPTDVLYAQWASTYDTDGNILQAVDDTQMHDLLPEFIRLTELGRDLTKGKGGVLRILDLGCGTGRNTIKLLQADWKAEVDVVGWDSSDAMLELAKSKLEVIPSERSRNFGIELEQVDIVNAENVHRSASKSFDGLISTLVLEHIPIETYFAILAKVLKPGSYALVTNMHADMGAQSKAGYKTASGERFKATSYVYTVQSGGL